MKPVFILIFCFLLSFASKASGPKITFFIRTEIFGDKDADGKSEAELLADVLKGKLQEIIKSEFPCVQFCTQESLYAVLENERSRQLLGGEDDNRLDLKDCLNADYLLVLKIGSLAGKLTYSIKVLDPHLAIAIVNVFQTSPSGEAGLDAIPGIAQKVMNQLKKYEICPFRGPVKISVMSHKQHDSIEQYSVYCNNQDETFKRTTSNNQNASTELDVKKLGKEYSSGYMKFSEKDSTVLLEENGCYKCPSGRMGGRISTEIFVTDKLVKDFSNESSKDGAYTSDVRIKLIFNEDSTYLISLKGASKRKGKGVQTVYQKAEGTCDNKNGPPDVYKNDSVSVPCRFIFGPFKGAPSQKSFQETQDKTTTDPVSGEETTIHFEFTLKRD
jgi:hypothetical protein